MKVDAKVVAICGLVILGTTALICGRDGVLFGAVIAAISGIAGFALHDPIVGALK